jgi:hypothetical protein
MDGFSFIRNHEARAQRQTPSKSGADDESVRAGRVLCVDDEATQTQNTAAC